MIARSIARYRLLGLEQRNQPTEDAEPVFMGEARERPSRPSLRHVAVRRRHVDSRAERRRAHGIAASRFEDHGNAHSL